MPLIFCEYCKRYYLDIFYQPHKKMHKYMCFNVEKKYDFI